MANIVTLGTAAYETAKKQALNAELIRKEISLSEFNVINNTTIEIDGKQIEVSRHAFNKILSRLRIPKAFAKRFSEGFGEDGLRQLISMMKTAKSSKSDQTVTLIVDPVKRQVTDVLPSGYASISNESFLNFVERYIDGYNLGVTHFGSDTRGGVQINTSAPNAIFKVPGMDNEIFNTGVTFSNTPDRGLLVSPYLNRLICSNGMSSTAFSETFGLHQFNEKNINEFNDHMIRMASTGFQPAGLADKISKANNTDASLAELQRAASMIMGADKTVDWDYIQRYVPIERANAAYTHAGIDPATLTAAQLKNAKSGMSVWDVVNGVTNFASNDNRYRLDDSKRGNLMVSAGNLLMKNQYDTEGLLQVDPFANRQLLSERESAILRGEN
jgi:hypothetical protein